MNGRLVQALAFTALFTAACAESSGPEPLSSLTVSPTTATVAVTGTLPFTAAGTRAGATVSTLKGSFWTVSGGGTISDAGVFTAGSTPGTSTVTVNSGGKSAIATVTVVPGPLAAITVTGSPATLALGARQQLTAVGSDASGNVVPITPVWSAASPAGTIDAGTGLFTAGTTAGTFVDGVRASSGAISGTGTIIVTPGPLASVTVTPRAATVEIFALLPDLSRPKPASQQQFTAVGRDAHGNVVPITPVWSVKTYYTCCGFSGTRPYQPGDIGSTGLFTAHQFVGKYERSVIATSGSFGDAADVTVIAGPLARLVIEPESPVTLVHGGVQTYTVAGRDAVGHPVAIDPTWSVTGGGGTILADPSGLTATFTAGNTNGTFTNTVRVAQGAVFATATVIVVPQPPPPPSSLFLVHAHTAVTCTDGNIRGYAGTFEAAPTGSITLTDCPIINGTDLVGTGFAVQGYNEFVAAYDAFENEPCGTRLTGTPAGWLQPGVYCFGRADLTGRLTLVGPSTGTWLFQIGRGGEIGTLTATNFSVVLYGGASACNVTWWTRGAATLTDTNMQGAVLAGGNITSIRGRLSGHLWSQGDVAITGTPLSDCTTTF
jgi:hypothetical protein